LLGALALRRRRGVRQERTVDLPLCPATHPRPQLREQEPEKRATHMDIKDLLFFDKMVMPKVITFIYWLALLGVVVGGLVTMFQSFLAGLAVLIGGAIAVRLYSELFVVLFKMNEALQDIRSK
jgi:hypothetical protein